MGLFESRKRHTPLISGGSGDPTAEEVIALYGPHRDKTIILEDYTPTEHPGVNRNQRQAVAAILERLEDASKVEVGIVIGVLGAMGGGKTTTLCLLAESVGPRKASVFKHELDLSRTGPRLVNHSGDVETTARLYTSLQDITPEAPVTIIDEFHFAGDDPASLTEFISRQREKGEHTVFSLLDFTFRREPWGLAHAVLELADHVVVVQPQCTDCRQRPAEFTQRNVDGKPAHVDDETVIVGAEELYLAACGFCHEVLGKPKTTYQ